jgi:hypothetical protein
MTRMLRGALCALLAGLSAAPANAEIVIPPAARGELVVVQLRDGREIVGDVGGWLGDLGFYVKPPDSAAYLIHREDVAGICDAQTGAPRTLPRRERHVMSRANKISIAVIATLAGLFLILPRVVPAGG